MSDNESAMALTNHTLKILVIISISLIVAAFPISIYFHFVFRKLGSSIMVRKRHPQILYIQSIFTSLCFLLVFPLMILDFSELDEFEGTARTVLAMTNRLLFPFAGPYPVFLCIAWRFWHVYFDLKYNSSQKNSEWKYHLDPQLVQHNFWLSRKATFGTVAWMGRRIVAYWFATATLNVFAYAVAIFDILELGGDAAVFSLIGHAAAVLFVSASVTVIFVIYLKIPQYSDNFFVKEELQFISIASAISIPFSIGAVTYGLLSSPALLFTVIILYVAILLFMASWYSLRYIPIKIHHHETDIRLRKIAQIQGNRLNGDLSVYSSSDDHDNARGAGAGSGLRVEQTNPMEMGGIVRRLSQLQAGRGVSYKLHVVLSQENTFKFFMQHLGKEFSTECLLCFAEIVQYKFAFKQRIDIVEGANRALTAEPGFTDECPLSQVVPLSVIVREGFEENLRSYRADVDATHLFMEAKIVCFALFQKYIKNGCELEVNISYSMRARLKNLMSSRRFWYSFPIELDALFTLYDDVAEQMFRLMDGAFVRFKQQREIWKTVQQILKHRHATIHDNRRGRAFETLPATLPAITDDASN